MNAVVPPVLMEVPVSTGLVHLNAGAVIRSFQEIDVRSVSRTIKKQVEKLKIATEIYSTGPSDWCIFVKVVMC